LDKLEVPESQEYLKQELDNVIDALADIAQMDLQRFSK